MLANIGRTRDPNLVVDTSADSAIAQPAPINKPTGKATGCRGMVESPVPDERKLRRRGDAGMYCDYNMPVVETIRVTERMLAAEVI
jgi:hypothetical protein